MGFDQYHEPANELSAETRTFARMCANLTEEAEAIGWYEQRMSLEPDAVSHAIMADSLGEEFKHFSMDLEFLLRQKPLWRETARGILFQDGDIVENGERSEAEAGAKADGGSGGGGSSGAAGSSGAGVGGPAGSGGSGGSGGSRASVATEADADPTNRTTEVLDGLPADLRQSATTPTLPLPRSGEPGGLPESSSPGESSGPGD